MIGGRPVADLLGPGGGQAVHDDVDLNVGGVAAADVFEELQHHLGVHRAGSESNPETVGADVVGAQQLASALVLLVGGPLAGRPVFPNQPRPGWGLREMGPHSSSRPDPVEGAGLGCFVGAQHPLLLLFVEGVVGPLPGAGPLGGDAHLVQ